MSLRPELRSEVIDLLAAAGPDRFRVGMPADGAVPLSAFKDPGTVASLVDRACTSLRTAERTAAGFSLYYGAAGALVGPAFALLLAVGDELVALDPHRTMLSLRADGLVDGIWPMFVVQRRRRARRIDDVAEPLRVGLAEVTAAFRPQLRIGPRSYAAAAGGVLAQYAERIGRQMGRVRPARAMATALAASAAPQVRVARYEVVDLGPGRRTAPVGTVCCQWFRLAPGAFCAGCPREPEPSRSARLRDHLDRTMRPAVDDLLVEVDR